MLTSSDDEDKEVEEVVEPKPVPQQEDEEESEELVPPPSAPKPPSRPAAREGKFDKDVTALPGLAGVHDLPVWTLWRKEGHLHYFEFHRGDCASAPSPAFGRW